MAQTEKRLFMPIRIHAARDSDGKAVLEMIGVGENDHRWWSELYEGESLQALLERASESLSRQDGDEPI